MSPRVCCSCARVLADATSRPAPRTCIASPRLTPHHALPALVCTGATHARATHTPAVYFAIIRSLEGHPELIMATLQAKFVPTLAANYMIWPLAHLVNFKFVPSE